MATLPIWDEEIRAEASCEQWPVRLFWPEAQGGPGQVPSTVAEADYMLRVCQACPVQGLCLTVRPDNGVGVWGGYMFGELAPKRTRPPRSTVHGKRGHRASLLQLVRKDPGITTREISDVTGLSKKDVSRDLLKLANLGQVRNRVLTPTGPGGARGRFARWYPA